MTKEELFGSQPNDNNTGFVSFEEMENAFKTPTQMQGDYEPKPEPTPPMGDLGHLADPDGSASFEMLEPDDAPEPVSPEKAQRTGMRIARLVDTGIDFTLSNFVAKNGESYKADERDLQDIAECWGELAQEKGWSVGPELSLVILYIMVYGPLVKQAVADRRMAELEARQAALEAQMKLMQMQQQGKPQPDDTTNPNPTATPSPTPSAFDYRPS